LPRSTLVRPSNTIFPDTVSGKSARSQGWIALEVIFGTTENFHKETLHFEVVDFKRPFRAIFGRVAFAKFMAPPYYTYMKMKLSGPKGGITIVGDLQKATECEKGSAVFVDSTLNDEELAQFKNTFDFNYMASAKRLADEAALTSKLAQETKKI
jgi:hypothetical protein